MNEIEGEIPEDVVRTAKWIVDRTPPRQSHATTVALAILAERERCAKVAEGLMQASTPGMPLFGAGMCNAADQIALAIRSPQHTETEVGE